MHPSQRRVSDKERKAIIIAYQSGEVSVYRLMRRFGYSDRTITRVLENAGIYDATRAPRRRVTRDSTVFDIIDTEPKAYWLGFLYADGCHMEEIYRIAVTLAAEDRAHMEKYASFLCYGASPTLLKSKRARCQDGVRVCFRDRRMSQSLSSLGVYSRKSIHCTFPTSNQVPLPLLRHFVRGYFDGDGCLSLHLRRGVQMRRPEFGIRIVGTQEFLRPLGYLIQTQLGLPARVGTSTCAQPYMGVITFGGNRATQRFLDWLYDGATVSLQRKHERYETLKRLNAGGGFSDIYENEGEHRYADYAA